MQPTHDDSDRKQIHVKVCRSSWEGWEDYARREGVTLAALLDAIGHQLAAVAGRNGTQLGKSVVPEAREIDADRRRRG